MYGTMPVAGAQDELAGEFKKIDWIRYFGQLFAWLSDSGIDMDGRKESATILEKIGQEIDAVPSSLKKRSAAVA